MIICPSEFGEVEFGQVEFGQAAQMAANKQRRPDLSRNHLCTRALDLADSTEGSGSAGCAQSSARPIPGGCPQAFAACSLCRREIEKGGWGWKIAFTEVFGPHRIENFKAVHRLLNPMPPSCPVRRSQKRSKSTPSQRLTAQFVPSIRTASAGSRADWERIAREFPSSVPFRSAY
jgi:hypothetical protein